MFCLFKIIWLCQVLVAACRISSSLTRDQTQAPCNGSLESTTRPQSGLFLKEICFFPMGTFKIFFFFLPLCSSFTRWGGPWVDFLFFCLGFTGFEFVD